MAAAVGEVGYKITVHDAEDSDVVIETFVNDQENVPVMTFMPQAQGAVEKMLSSFQDDIHEVTVDLVELPEGAIAYADALKRIETKMESILTSDLYA